MGAQVAMQAADVVLADPISRLSSSNEEGSAISDNLKKNIAYAPPFNHPCDRAFIVSAVLDFPLPLTTRLILAIVLGTDVLPVNSFAYEPVCLGIMKRKL